MADWLIGTSNDGYPFLDGVSLDAEIYVRTTWFVTPKTDNLWGINSKVNDGYPFILFQFDMPSGFNYIPPTNCFRYVNGVGFKRIFPTRP